MASNNKIETRYLEASEFDHWDHFVDLSKHGTVYHKTIWLARFAEWQQLQLKVVGCYKGTELVGGMAFTKKLKFGSIPVMQMPVKTPYFGPVLANTETKYLSKIESQQQSIVQTLVDFLMTETKYFYAMLSPSFSDTRPLIWKGFDASIHYTYIGRLSKDLNLLDSYDPSVRRQIKKGKQQKYNLHIDNAREYIQHAWELEQRSFKRQKLDLVYASEENFIGFIESLSKEGLAQTYTITFEGLAISSQIVILDPAKKMAYYWLAGADPAYLSTGLNQLLLHSILEDLQEKGYEGFDFVGAGNETISRYKSTFNFPLVPMYSVNKAQGMARLGMMVKNLIR